MLKNNAAKDIANAIYWSPTPCKTYGLAASSSMFDKMLEVIDVEKIPLPPFLCGLDEALAGGIALGEVVNIVSSCKYRKNLVYQLYIDALDYALTSSYFNY